MVATSLTPADLVLMVVITALTAIPAVAISVVLSVRWLVRQQLLGLPELLADPAVEVAVRRAMARVGQCASGGFSAALAASLVDSMRQEIGKALEVQGTTLTATIKGQLGAFVRNLKADLEGKDRPPGQRPGALGGLGALGDKVGSLVQLLSGAGGPLKLPAAESELQYM